MATLHTMPLETVPDSAVIDGVPQGIFVGRSLLTGRAVCLMFLTDGRISRAIPAGGLQRFDWAAHAATHSGDVGTWQMAPGTMTVSWADGGVHSGPLTVDGDAIEFYGKRYRLPKSTGLAELVGRWESASGTAVWGGSGVNQLSRLVVAPDGRFAWEGTVGGVVEGLAAAGESASSGTIEIIGLTTILRMDDGSVTEHTFLPAAGEALQAFSLDDDLFTRSS